MFRSVLGVVNFKGVVPQNSSLDSFDQTGFWYDVLHASDSPVASTTGDRTMLLVLRAVAANRYVRMIQFVFDMDTYTIYMRAASDSVFNSWKHIQLS